MLTAAPGRKTAEAAQANRGGLECSSYTWQVRRRRYAVGMPKSQAESGLTLHGGCQAATDIIIESAR